MPRIVNNPPSMSLPLSTGKNVVTTETNGRYVGQFIVDKTDAWVKLLNTSDVANNYLVDNYFQMVQLEIGHEATSYTDPASDKSQLQAIFKNLINFELSAVNEAGTIGNKIKFSSDGIMSHFYNAQGQMRVDQGSFAHLVFNRMEQQIEDSSTALGRKFVSERQQTAQAIIDSVRSDNFRTAIQQNGSNIILGIQNAIRTSNEKAKDLLTAINLAPNGVQIKGELISLDGNTHMTNAFARNLITQKLASDDVTAFVGKFDTAIINKLVANNAVLHTLQSKIIEADVLKGYTGLIGGFRIGRNPNATHGNTTLGDYITGIDQFEVGISSGKNLGPGNSVFWVNWDSKDWNRFGYYTFNIQKDGQMFCRNKAQFSGGVEITGGFASFQTPTYIEGKRVPKFTIARDSNGQYVRVEIDGESVVLRPR